jgi:alkylated DNA repair dioxygenase AlkB
MERNERGSNYFEQLISQGALFIENDNDIAREKEWYGLRISNRQLVEALENDFIYPLEFVGTSLGRQGYADNVSNESGSFAYPVYLRIDPSLLPLQPSLPNALPKSHLDIPPEQSPMSQLIVWPHLLPLSCITEIAVLEEEHLQRLANVEYMAGNLRLPLVPVLRHDIGTQKIYHPRLNESKVVSTIPPQELDAYRGSICMAYWGVPKMQPWINALCVSLRPKGSASQEFDADLPRWIQNLPWDKQPLSSQVVPKTLDDVFWEVASTELVQSCILQQFSTYKFVETCASRIRTIMAQEPGNLALVDDWERLTINLLKGTVTFQFPKDILQPVPIALQMLLLRPKPEQFKSWVHDYPDVPVAIWYAGLLLCGLLTGYHRLSLAFRGYHESNQSKAATKFNQLLLLFLLEKLSHSSLSLHWPQAPRSQPIIRIVGDRFNLYWDQHLIGARRPAERESWLNADLNDSVIYSSAIALARRLGWNCTHNTLLLSSGTYALSKKGQVELIRGDTEDKLSVVGASVELVGDVEFKVVSKLDKPAFRRCLLQNGGDFRRSDLKQYHSVQAANSNPSDVRIYEETASAKSTIWERISGLILSEDFLSEQEEAELLRQLDAASWEYIGDKDSRRVQHYGWRYLYKAKKVSMSDKIGPLPLWADNIAYRLAEWGLMPYVADQVIVNEYIKSQGIAMHIDCLPCFNDVIISVSMLEEWSMKFQKAKEQELVSLPRRSALVISGAARSEWKHGIDKRTKDPSGHIRGRRISLTFRKVRATA